MQTWDNSGFSLNASVRVETWDKEGLDRLLRYCARPPFASENLKMHRDMLVYRFTKTVPGGMPSIQLSPLELLDRIAVFIPPPRSHQHHYHGVFAPNSPLHSKVTSHTNKLLEEYVPPQIKSGKVQKDKNSYSWAKLLAKVYEVFPLTCTCGEAMKIIAFITSPSIVRHILTHLKFLSNPFDPLPLEAREYENDSQLISETPDGLTSMLEPITSDDIYQENACSQLVLGTTDVF